MSLRPAPDTIEGNASNKRRIGANVLTDKESLADGVRDRAIADDSPHARRAPEHHRWTGFLKHRWPTALGIAVAALAAFDLQDGTKFSALVVAMALVYLGAAALDRRRSAWVVLLAALAVVVVTDLLDSKVDPSVVFLVAALVFVVLGLARGQLQRPGGLTLQAAGMLAFGATALVALYVSPDLGSYLVAFALLGHAAWDAVHFRLDRVVPRSYAEFCGVLDLLLGVTILLMT
jgi:hypothetical protein